LENKNLERQRIALNLFKFLWYAFEIVTNHTIIFIHGYSYLNNTFSFKKKPSAIFLKMKLTLELPI